MYLFMISIISSEKHDTEPSLKKPHNIIHLYKHQNVLTQVPRPGMLRNKFLGFYISVSLNYLKIRINPQDRNPRPFICACYHQKKNHYFFLPI